MAEAATAPITARGDQGPLRSRRACEPADTGSWDGRELMVFVEPRGRSVDGVDHDDLAPYSSSSLGDDAKGDDK
jgi:hypothetical protein